VHLHIPTKLDLNISLLSAFFKVFCTDKMYTQNTHTVTDRRR